MQELENKKAALELLQNETNEKLNDYKQQISILQKQIEDYNKPELTPRQLDNIQEAIEDAVGTYNFDEVDMYDIDFSLDYDGRVQAETINLRDTYELIEAIVTGIEKEFKVINKDETTN